MKVKPQKPQQAPLQNGVWVNDEPALMKEAQGYGFCAYFDEVYPAIDNRLTYGDNIQYAPYHSDPLNMVMRMNRKDDTVL